MSKLERTIYKAVQPPVSEGDRSTLDAELNIKEVDPIVQRYSRLIKQYPQLGVHLSAVEQLNTYKRIRNAKLEDEDKEALLIYSLWSEDPVTAVEIGESAGVPERKLNQYVDIAMFKMKSFSDTMLGIVAGLRSKAEATQVIERPQYSPIPQPLDVPEPVIEVPAPVIVNPTKPPSAPVIDRNVLYTDTEKAPVYGNLAQSYDHPILQSGQERTLFSYLKNGASIEEVQKDTNFINSFDPTDIPKIARILDQSATVEEVVSSCYLRLVDVIARSFRGLPLPDAINTGNIGLIQAARKWEPGEKGRFSTYAVWAIRSAISQEAYGEHSAIKIPAYVQQDMSKAKWIAGAFQHLFGRPPTNEELRKQLLANTDMPRWRVNTIFRVIESKVEHVGSINTPISPDGKKEDEIGNFIPDKAVDVEAAVVQRIADEELRRETRRALKEHLTEEEQQVIKALYGLNDSSEKSPEEVACKMSTTKERVIDIERKSLGKLRFDKWLREHWTEEPPSYIYGRSAEKAAFRLGLFEDYPLKPLEPVANQKLKEAPHNGPVAAMQPAKIERETILFDRSQTNGKANVQLVKHREITSGTPVSTRYQDVVSQLLPGRVIKITPERPESLSEIWSYALKVAKKVGKKIKITKTKEGTLLVRLKTERNTKQTLEKIKELRNQGVKNKEIAVRLGLSFSTVRTYASILIKDGQITALPHKTAASFRPKPRERKPDSVIAKVKQLRNQGYRNREIAKILGTSYHNIASSTAKLLERGEITPLRKRGRKDPDQAARIKGVSTEAGKSRGLIDSVKELRLQGFKITEIADKLGYSTSTISRRITQLIKLGKIAPLPKGRKKAAVVEDLESPKKNSQPMVKKIDQIRQLRLEGLSNQQIAEKTGYPPNTVTFYASKLVSNGEIPSIKGKGRKAVARSEDTVVAKVKQLRNKGYNNQQITQMLGVSSSAVRSAASILIRRGEITPLKGNKAKDQAERVAAVSEETELVKQYLEAHPRPSYKDGFKRIFSAREKRKTPEDIEFENRVKELRQQGLSNIQIAKQLNERTRRVEAVAVNLLKRGEIKPFRAPHDPNFDLQVLEFRLQGLTNMNISRQLGIGVKRVEKAAMRLIRKGKLEPIPLEHRGPRATRVVRERRVSIVEFEAQVKELRDQGLTNKQIAERLETSRQKVELACHNLIVTGALKPRSVVQNPKERAAKIADAKNFRERVKELSIQGLSSIQIAESLGDSVRRVHFNMWKLNKDGEVKLSSEQLRPAGRIGYVDKHAITPTGEIYEKVAEMRNQGMRNGEIAKVLGLSQHRVEVYASNLILAGVIESALGRKTPYRVGVVDPDFQFPQGKNYNKVAELRNQGLNNKQIAMQLNISSNSVSNMASKLIRAGIIKPKKLTAEEKEAICTQIKEFRGQGLSSTEISKRLSQPINRIHNLTRELIKAGEIKPFKVRMAEPKFK